MPGQDGVVSPTDGVEMMMMIPCLAAGDAARHRGDSDLVSSTVASGTGFYFRTQKSRWSLKGTPRPVPDITERDIEIFSYSKLMLSTFARYCKTLKQLNC